MEVDKDSLRELFATNPVAKEFFSNFSERERNRRVINVDWMERTLSTPQATRANITAFLKSLESTGVGKYIEGRKGNRSRFEWEYPSKDISLLARGLDNFDQTGSEDIDDIPDEELRHPFRLRPDYVTTITLPSDLSQAEAERLASFIKTLPFGQ